MPFTDLAAPPEPPAWKRWDWPTLGLLAGVMVFWVGALALPQGWGLAAFVLLLLALTLHSSLSHEILHGHPFGVPWAETALGLWQPGLLVPYLRFKRLHLAHHRDANLTDPYDDPESNYLDPDVWQRLPYLVRGILAFNNTLAGRMIVGPVIGMIAFWGADLRAARSGQKHVVFDWMAHLPGTAVTLAAVYWSDLGFGVYFLACYGAASILRIRTFLEHQAHQRVSGRTAIVEDRGLLGFLFLNNNLHVVHHMYPTVAWYRLWPLYSSNRARFVTRNHGYVYRSYGAVFRQYLLRRKDDVPHPLWQSDPK